MSKELTRALTEQTKNDLAAADATNGRVRSMGASMWIALDFIVQNGSVEERQLAKELRDRVEEIYRQVLIDLLMSSVDEE